MLEIIQPEAYVGTSNVIFKGAVISFPNIIEPKLNTADRDPKRHFLEYSVDILIPKSVDKTRLEDIISAVIDERWGSKVPDFRNGPTIKDGDKKFNKEGEPYQGYPGNWYITAKSNEKNKPVAIDAAKNELTALDSFVGGDIADVFVSVYAYGPNMGNAGVSFQLNGAKIREKTDSPFGGGVSKNAVKNSLAELTDDDFGI